MCNQGECGVKCLVLIVFVIALLIGILGVCVLVTGILLYTRRSNQASSMESTDANLIFMCIFAVVLLIVAILGMVGSCKRWHGVVFGFTVLLIVMLLLTLAFIICVVMALNRHIDEQVLKKSFNSAENRAEWHDMQEEFECCGVDGPSDWGRDLPISCCMAEPPNAGDPPNDKCKELSTKLTYIKNIGCHQKLEQLIRRLLHIALAFFIILVILEVLGIIFGCLLRAAIKCEDCN